MPPATHPCPTRRRIGLCKRAWRRDACAWILIAALPVQAVLALAEGIWRPAHYHAAPPVAELDGAQRQPNAPSRDDRLAGAGASVAVGQAVDPVADAVPPMHQRARPSAPEILHAAAHGHSHDHHDRAHAHAGDARDDNTLRQAIPRKPQAATAPATRSDQQHDTRHAHQGAGIGHHRHAPGADGVVYVDDTASADGPLRTTERRVTATDSLAWLSPSALPSVIARRSPVQLPAISTRYRSIRTSPLLRPPR